MAKFRRAGLILALACAAPATAQVRNLPQPGAFVIEAPPGGASYRRLGRIERRTAAGWENGFDEFALTDDCSAAPPPACVALTPGQTLRPVPWTGYACAGQCPRACKGEGYLPSGTFRLTLTACGDGAEFSGPAFDMPGPPKQ